jgi:hypothetical protein
MRKIKPELTDEIQSFVKNLNPASASPFRVSEYRELVEYVAHLSYLNKDSLLFFRGQDKDFQNKAGSSTFYPTIYRGDSLPAREVQYRFEKLSWAAKQLVKLLSKNHVFGSEDVRRKEQIQWSILQHYGVCDTPLLDFTHSLRVACSFAQLGNTGSEGFVYVFALPYITNRISVNSEHDLINIRLLSICPPKALRPHFQEGYLAGTTDITSEYENKSELDFNNRLVAKFSIPNNKSFWGKRDLAIPKDLLYPQHDEIADICKLIQTGLPTTLQPGLMGEYIKSWAKLEQYIFASVHQYSTKLLSTRQAITIISQEDSEFADIENQVQRLRKFRNQLVHYPENIQSKDIQKKKEQLDVLLSTLKL